MEQFHLHTPDAPPAPVSPRIQIRDGRIYLILQAKRIALSAPLPGWAGLFGGVALPEPAQPARLRPGASNWDWLTPQAVIEYFRQSPVLAHMANDVLAALADEIAAEGLEEPSQLARDLAALRPHASDLVDEDGEAVYGAQSEAGRILGVPNAGNYRQRILTALEALEADSTTSNVRKLPDGRVEFDSGAQESVSSSRIGEVA